MSNSSTRDGAGEPPALPGTAIFPGEMSEYAMVLPNWGEWRSRGYLPHFDAGHVLQGVTYRLNDPLPSKVLQVYQQRLESIEDETERAVKLRAMIDRYLDRGNGAGILQEPAVAKIIVENWMYHDGRKYRLIAWVVMPNHVHVLIETLPGHPLGELVHSWKSYTAHRIGGGAIWQREYWDRYIRDRKHFASAVSYIHENPVKAGLVARPEDWTWSSGSAGGSPASAR
ncbi:MAG: putative transposase [Rhodothermales bacterium]|jgi:putative transposase